MPTALAEAVERTLGACRVRLSGDLTQLSAGQPVSAELEADGRTFRVSVVYQPDASAGAVLQMLRDRAATMPLLIVGPRVNAKSADMMRNRGIWFVDGAGNAFLRDAGLLVDVRGRRAEPGLGVIERVQSDAVANPFTPKRARVVFALLADPELVDAPFRTIAQRAGVSLGIAKQAIDALQSVGFVEQLGSRRRLIRGSELLDLWSSTYPGGLGRSNRIFVGRGDVRSWSLPTAMTAAISGEQAVPQLIRNPESLVVYIVDGDRAEDVLRELIFQNRWRSDPHGNIIVRDLFWRDLPPLAGHGTAPAPLVYADLLASQEPRQLEVAREIRRGNERLGGL